MGFAARGLLLERFRLYPPPLACPGGSLLLGAGGADPAGAYVAADGYLPYVEGYDPRVFVVTLDVALLVPYCSSGGARALCVNTEENTRARKAPSLR